MILYFQLFVAALNSAMMVYTYSLFFDTFFTRQGSRATRLSVHLGLWVIYTVILYAMPIGLVRTVLMTVAPYPLALLFRYRTRSRILLSMAIIGISELLITALISSVFVIDMQGATQGIFQIIGIIASRTVFILFIATFRMRKYRMSYDIPTRHLLTLIAIPLSTLIKSWVHIYWMTKVALDSHGMNTPIILVYLLLIFCNIVVFHIIDFSFKNAEKEKQFATAQVAAERRESTPTSTSRRK